jgi:Uncharacterized protein conserved in bacteria (DUF2325)
MNRLGKPRQIRQYRYIRMAIAEKESSVPRAAAFRASFRETIPQAALQRQFLVQPSPLLRQAEIAEAPPNKRSRIWEFDTNLHCSIIGTCLSTAELRQILTKLGLASPESTDHELHGTAVRLAGRHDIAAKLLNKALDRRHHLVINQFAKARSDQEVAQLWRASVGRGEIPGAYWVTLTHPATTAALIREAFGEVHMLSHLVGAANRADIRRLRELESLTAELEAKLDRQQAAFRVAVTERDETLRELRQALTDQILSQQARADIVSDDRTAALHGLVADLEKRLATETRRRLATDDRLAKLRIECDRERDLRVTAERQTQELTVELEAVEAALSEQSHDSGGEQTRRLDGLSVLYVGGRSNHVAHLRSVSEQLGADLLHHDGGKEQHPDLLAGLVSRADLIVFPVDCVSHDAALSAKRLCRQAGKPFIALRSASVTTFVAALAQASVQQLTTDSANGDGR